MTSVAVVEDNENVRQTLRGWIDSSPDCRCVYACRTGEAALVEIAQHGPDVVLMDVQLPVEFGITCISQLKKRVPGLNVIVFTVNSDDDMIFQALRAGACGYLLKRSSREEILWAITEARSGGAPMTGAIARRVVAVFQRSSSDTSNPVKVTRRENEVLDLLSKGLSNKQIAGRLGISYETVCVHLRRIYKKFHVRSRMEAVIEHLQLKP